MACYRWYLGANLMERNSEQAGVILQSNWIYFLSSFTHAVTNQFTIILWLRDGLFLIYTIPSYMEMPHVSLERRHMGVKTYQISATRLFVQ